MVRSGFPTENLMHVLKYNNNKQISNDKSIIKNWRIRMTVENPKTVNTDDE